MWADCESVTLLEEASADVELEEARKSPPLQLAVEDKLRMPLQLEEGLWMSLQLDVEAELDPPVEDGLPPPPLQLYQPPPSLP